MEDLCELSLEVECISSSLIGQNSVIWPQLMASEDEKRGLAVFPQRKRSGLVKSLPVYCTHFIAI